jgi:hypothetical protein
MEIEWTEVVSLLFPLQAREIEHVVDQAREPFRFRHDDAQILRRFFRRRAPALHQLRKHANRSERRLELMRDVGNEVALLLRERELPPRILKDDPAAECDRAQRRRNQKHERAANVARVFLQLLRPLQIKCGFPMRQHFADLRGHERPLPIA